MNAPEQLTGELKAVIDRYALESDLDVATVIGVLEILKMDLLEWAIREQTSDNEAS